MVFSQQAVEKVIKNWECHSEQSEESRIFKFLRPFALLRVTRKWTFSAGCQSFNERRRFLPKGIN
jgi:hypothetical protein